MTAVTRADRNEQAVRLFLDRLHDLATPDFDAALEDPEGTQRLDGIE